MSTAKSNMPVPNQCRIRSDFMHLRLADQGHSSCGVDEQDPLPWRERLGLERPKLRLCWDLDPSAYTVLMTTMISLPLWLFLSVLSVPSLLLWRWDRKPRAGHCRRCDYDLTGNVSGVCPECGTRCETQKNSGNDSREGGCDPPQADAEGGLAPANVGTRGTGTISAASRRSGARRGR